METACMLMNDPMGREKWRMQRKKKIARVNYWYVSGRVALLMSI